MSRYIDADKKLTITVYDDEHEENIDRYMTIEEILETYTSEGCPTTADVVEVVHGKWEVSELGYPYCSKCGTALTKSVPRTNYCSCCGADMRGELNEKNR